MNLKRSLNLILLPVSFTIGIAFSSNLPKYELEDLNYLGSFRLPSATYGEGRVAWSTGKIAVNSANQTFFFSGSNKVSIAEFSLPEALSKATNIAEIPIIPAPIQPFTKIFEKSETGNTNGVDYITGLSWVNGKLVVSTAVYYDAAVKNDHTTLIVENPSNIANSEIRGFFRLEARHRAAGWISKVPDSYKEVFGADLIAGNSSTLAINGRNSMGPSAYLLQSSDLDKAQANDILPNDPLLYFTINHWLHPDIENKTLENDLWTELSSAEYGFIVPGTSTYLTIGSSGGHASGIGYKITQENGYQCGGFCAIDYKDYYNYYWLWDVNDLIDVHTGKKLPYDIKPYDRGVINIPFETPKDDSNSPYRLGGVTHTEDGKLYFVLNNVDTLQNQFESLPIVLVYDLFSNRILSPTNLRSESN